MSAVSFLFLILWLPAVLCTSRSSRLFLSWLLNPLAKFACHTPLFLYGRVKIRFKPLFEPKRLGMLNQASPSDSATTRPLRPLLPAASPRNEAPPTQSKRARVPLACAACRVRKSKCNGERPSCSECVARDSPCQYAETENTQTKRRHRYLEELFQLLRDLPEEEAGELLARIRAGMDPKDIVDTVRHGNMLVQFASTMESSRDSESTEADGGIGSSGGGRSGSVDKSGDSQEQRKDSDLLPMQSS